MFGSISNPMIDILVYLFENYYDFSSHPRNEALARKLGAVGFEEKDITEALGWLTELKNAHISPFSCGSHSTRVFSHAELGKFGIDCFRFILFLESAELITPAQRELIIDLGMMLEDNPVPLAKFKIIVLMVLWSSQENLEPLIVEELLYDSDPLMLH